jgi:hypothetical protein
MNDYRPAWKPQPLVEHVRWANEHGGLRGALGDALKSLVLEHGITDTVIEQLVYDQTRPLVWKHASGNLPPFKAAQLSHGDFVLGPDIYGANVYYVLQWLTEHLHIIARSGGGKSTFLVVLVLAIASLGTSVWVTDFYKKTLRRLRKLCARSGVTLVVLRADRWRWNLLQSNLRDARTHLATVVDLCVRILQLPPRAAIILRQVIHELYCRFGIYEGNKETCRYPTLFDVFEVVRKRSDLNAAAREAILDRLASFLVSVTPHCAAWRRAWSPKDLARFSIIFEFETSSEGVKQLLLESTAYGVFQAEVEQGIPSGPVGLFIAFDDGQRFLSGNGSVEFSSLAELLGIVRGARIAFCLLTQSSIGMPRSLVPNIGSRFFGVLGSAEDWQLASESGLTSEQIAWAKLHLEPRGMFIGIVSAAEYREPFLFRVPRLPLDEPVDDSEVEASLAPLKALPTEFAEEFRNWQPHLQQEVSGKEASHLQVSEVEFRFLQAVTERRDQPSSTYAKLVGISGKQAVIVRQRLVAAGFLREHQVAVSARGRHAILLEPTAAGMGILARGGSK